MKLTESDLTCDGCGEAMSCLLTGPESQPHTRATYICPNMDHNLVCRGAGWGRSFLEDSASPDPEEGQDGS